MTLQYFDDCPNWQTANERLRALADELDIHITYHRVSSVEEAEELAFRGSPTILIDGRDPFARGGEPSGLACRVYPTPDGARGLSNHRAATRASCLTRRRASGRQHPCYPAASADQPAGAVGATCTTFRHPARWGHRNRCRDDGGPLRRQL